MLSARQDILVVDDDPDFRELLVEHLRACGLRVRTARDGAEALAAMAAAPEAIALVLLDLRMPVLDGFEVCRCVDRSGPDVPIVVMTAEHETRGVAGASCVVAVLHKPLELDRLEAVVHAHVGGSA